MALAQLDEIARRFRAPCPVSRSRSSSSKRLVISTRPESCCRMAARAARSSRRSAPRYWQATFTPQCIRSRTCPAMRTRPGLVIGATLSRDPPGDALVLRPGMTLENFRRRAERDSSRHQRRAPRRLCAEAVSGCRGHPLSRRRRYPGAQARHAEKQRLPAGGEVGPADALIMARPASNASGLAAGSLMSFQCGKCCRRPGRASSRSNAPCRISRRARPCRVLTTLSPMPAPMPSAKCRGCSTATAIHRLRASLKSAAGRCRLSASVLR